MWSSGLKLSSNVARPPLPRAMTDPIVSWAMTKESIEELWVRSTRPCSTDSSLADLTLAVLLSGWNVRKDEVQNRVRAKWREVYNRWCRELSGMSKCTIDIEMMQLSDGQALKDLSQLGTRLFVAL